MITCLLRFILEDYYIHSEVHTIVRFLRWPIKYNADFPIYLVVTVLKRNVFYDSAGSSMCHYDTNGWKKNHDAGIIDVCKCLTILYVLHNDNNNLFSVKWNQYNHNSWHWQIAQT